MTSRLASSRPRILVVEDSATQAAALADLLESNGFDTVIARSGERALEVVRQERLDLVLTDVVMPGIDGYEVCRRIKSVMDLHVLPVILLTSLTDPLALVRGLASGADHYATKPYQPEGLLTRVREVLRRVREHPKEPAQPIKVELLGESFTIAATKEQILDLLVSSYGDLVQTSEAVRTAEQRARFLAEAGERLSSSLDVDQTFADLAKLSVPALADACIVEAFDDEGALRFLDVAYADPQLASCAAQLRERPPLSQALTLGLDVVRSGEGKFVANITDEYLREMVPDDEHRAAIMAFCPRSLVAVPIVARGRALGVVVLLTREARRPYEADDLALVTELARLAALAIDNARLYRTAQSATQARDDVLAIVSHDLRNPIHTIQMSASLVREFYASDAESPVAIQMAVIRRAAMRANSLIQDLLDVSRIEAGTLAVETAALDAASLIDEAVIEMRPIAEAGSITLTGSWMGPPTVIRGDRDRLMQVLSNLIGNALKFSPSGRTVNVTGDRMGTSARITVIDNGPGISADHMPHLFDRFWQATRAGRAGAGLGLFISKGIVDAHGGEVSVESTVGEGAQFSFTLPVAT
jgi:signal transduction histidine kinase/DNA-binding response OmpR family regulator